MYHETVSNSAFPAPKQLFRRYLKSVCMASLAMMLTVHDQGDTWTVGLSQMCPQRFTFARSDTLDISGRRSHRILLQQNAAKRRHTIRRKSLSWLEGRALLNSDRAQQTRRRTAYTPGPHWTEMQLIAAKGHANVTGVHAFVNWMI